MHHNLTSRQRVKTALEHEEPDRLPCDITIEPNVYEKLCKYMGETFEPYWWDDWNHAYPSIEMLNKLKVDVLHLCLNDTPRDFDIHLSEFKDQWGITKRKIFHSDGSFMYNLIDYPLKDAKSMDDILSYDWPRPEEIVDISGLRQKTEQLFKETAFALTATFGGNIFERPHYLRGMENFFLDLATDPTIATTLMDKVLEIQMAVDKMVFREIGEFLTYMRFRGEDLGSQNGLMISPQMFKDIVKPRLEKEWKSAKREFIKYNPDGKIMVHSCGAIFDLIPMFIDMGADMLNPIQPNAKGMNLRLMNEKYGDKICFHGSVDTQEVLTKGSIEDVVAEVKTRIKELGPGGGFILAPAHNIQYGVSPEKIIAMYEAVHEYGRYPINRT